MIATISPEVLVHQLFGVFLLPPLNMIILLVVAWCVLRRYPGASRWLIAVAAIGLYGMALPKTAMWLNSGLERYPPVELSQLKQVDAIVVLGAGKKPAPEYGRAEPSSDALIRLRYAAYLARYSGKPILVTGGSPVGGVPEAVVMARTLADDYGLQARWQEDKSNTTLENAIFSAKMLKADHVTRVALVTQSWHMRRAVPFFTAQGLQVVPAPTGFVRYDGPGVMYFFPQARAMQESYSAMREYIGLFFYGVRDRVMSLLHKERK